MKQGWEIKKLGDIGTFQRGGGFLKSDFVEDGYPCVHYGQIHTKFGVKTYNHLTCISEELALSKSKIANSGDIIIAITSEDVEGSCKCTAWLGDYDVAVGGHAAIFKHGLNPAFVAYYFRGPYFNTAKKVYAHGSKVVEIRPADIATINISYPSLSEQEKIVAELDCLSGIIEKKKQQLKELDNLAQSIFYEMFSNQDGTPVKLSQACSVVSGLVNPNDKPYCNYPHIGGANIESHSGKFVNVKLAKEENLISGKYPFDDTMILYSKIRPNLNKVALPSFKGICSADMYPLIPQNEFDKVFLKYILTQKVFLDYAISHSGRANIPKINREDLLNYEFLTYPITLQQDFASKIESIEKQKELIAQSIKETETLFNSRMDYYFN